MNFFQRSEPRLELVQAAVNLTVVHPEACELEKSLINLMRIKKWARWGIARKVKALMQQLNQEQLFYYYIENSKIYVGVSADCEYVKKRGIRIPREIKKPNSQSALTNPRESLLYWSIHNKNFYDSSI